MTERLHVIVNPRSAGGRTAKRWPHFKQEIEKRFGPFALSETTAPFSGEALAREALKDGASLILAIGGDGTFSEALNGFFEDGKKINPEAQLACLTSGTGCDLRKAMDWPEVSDAGAMLDLIKSGTTRSLDIGHMSLTRRDGTPGHRYFLNVTSFGLGGKVSEAVNNARISKWFGGWFSFTWHALAEGIAYKDQPVRIEIDDAFDEEVNATIAAVALCPWFGGGLKVAPKADPTDGLFDIVIGKEIPKPAIPGLLLALRSGAHVNHPNVTQRRGKRVRVTPLSDIKIPHDVDGEAAGSLPSTYDILPGALTIRG